MNLIRQIKYHFAITDTHDIARRYFVVNGFDGALTMLGLIIGFVVSTPTELSVVINVCLGVAIALGISGVSSAYVSEVAERQRALEELESAMISDLGDTAHGKAARQVPWMIAIVNGAAPFIISLTILMPLWLFEAGVELYPHPLYVAIAVALSLIFLLGVFLGKISGVSWVRSGTRTLLIAILTAVLIYVTAGH
jgi:predicted membrane protein (TIGR00267 family)